MNKIGTEKNPLKIAIVGSGPSGFYAAKALIESDIHIEVDMYERLPMPYGLVRSGVAPDHPKLKQVIKTYAKIAESPQFRFFGNVTIGKDVSVAELDSLYHMIVFTCGAETDRKLGIPGEELACSHTATEFVGWYNGHPDYQDRSFDLSHEVAVIIGQGNVAADVSRILAKTHDELKNTDITEHALGTLAKSNIREIYVVGRRGPAQAKFTPKELQEFGELDDCDAAVKKSELLLNPASETERSEESNVEKVCALFEEFAKESHSSKNKRVHFTFLKSPVEFVGTRRVEKIRLEINELKGEPFNQSARGTGEIVELEAGLVFRSIGYRGVPIQGVPFDDRRGVIPNSEGRIIDGEGVVPNKYVAGWIKRGPTGVIGTNRADSIASVKALLEDVENLSPESFKPGGEGAIGLLEKAAIRFVSFSDWKKIDQSEIERGARKGKPREKFTRTDEMLKILG